MHRRREFDPAALSRLCGHGRLVHRARGGERVRGCRSRGAARLRRALGCVGWGVFGDEDGDEDGRSGGVIW